MSIRSGWRAVACAAAMVWGTASAEAATFYWHHLKPHPEFPGLVELEVPDGETPLSATSRFVTIMGFTSAMMGYDDFDLGTTDATYSDKGISMSLWAFSDYDDIGDRRWTATRKSAQVFLGWNGEWKSTISISVETYGPGKFEISDLLGTEYYSTRHYVRGTWSPDIGVPAPVPLPAAAPLFAAAIAGLGLAGRRRRARQA